MLCPTKDLSFQGSEFRSLVPFYITANVDEWRMANSSLSISFYVNMNINQTLTQDHQAKGNMYDAKMKIMQKE